MTFDELWRLDLPRESVRVDSVDKEEALVCARSCENPNEPLLTSADYVFLSQVGIRP
jgi:hypothetical protein